MFVLFCFSVYLVLTYSFLLLVGHCFAFEVWRYFNFRVRDCSVLFFVLRSGFSIYGFLLTFDILATGKHSREFFFFFNFNSSFSQGL